MIIIAANLRNNRQKPRRRDLNLLRKLHRTPAATCHLGKQALEVHEIVAASAGCGVSPVVRVAEGQAWMIKRALDAGAHGILVPMLETADEARRYTESGFLMPSAMTDMIGLSQVFRQAFEGSV
ncbi:uncharacterized protein BO97DRAFT_445468 [Aspergillus homomorphus CBS 101889]|uniref:HpcH/HpaI aldolase/citrate lyase domain-containing protein n=1 Tax=Aspergillus homomorphus (strain CBS 101889) TaxID=1450537 RepID=A0A395HPK3_ASPHC|nr:hypothetical protein BO97DRAFT_445468 [Aspergillus homomorphus CBS 101889]RAL09353.1 hypothetical protein BO97DRAFT_445468 [Aspergillus homomorphus CBS 101889]